jgi:hypothetical protein
VRASRFLELTSAALHAEFVTYFKDVDRDLRKGQRRDVTSLQADAMEHTAGSLRPLENARQGGAICIAEAECWPWAGGDGIQLPAVRIPLVSVDLWWVTGGQVLKAPSQGSGWFVGAVFDRPGN